MTIDRVSHATANLPPTTLLASRVRRKQMGIVDRSLLLLVHCQPEPDLSLALYTAEEVWQLANKVNTRLRQQAFISNRSVLASSLVFPAFWFHTNKAKNFDSSQWSKIVPALPNSLELFYQIHGMLDAVHCRGIGDDARPGSSPPIAQEIRVYTVQ
ncbi:hypothetical protein J6590_023260 [Homalodisca vitripennis]|nr:hypothetical protein J6590_023260 [Homalodisca vitripennis]